MMMWPRPHPRVDIHPGERSVTPGDLTGLWCRPESPAGSGRHWQPPPGTDLPVDSSLFRVTPL